ncbi:hypothetical protein TPAR_06971 [Tolypocladium paradoxum]|uniref:Uncharacterized protein n=1 Tax=Tolypocladium paradoxum TaxID=94208 RepID=A0A2S4KRK5_9HYPO|nr:hypothetical protein TPAR_06971 [Tolypocladium paradoxum]
MPVPMRGQARTYHCQSMPAASASSHNALSSTGTSAQFARLGIAPQTLWSAKSRTSQSSSKNPSSSGSPWRTPRRLLVVTTICSPFPSPYCITRSIADGGRAR